MGSRHRSAARAVSDALCRRAPRSAAESCPAAAAESGRSLPLTSRTDDPFQRSRGSLALPGGKSGCRPACAVPVASLARPGPGSAIILFTHERKFTDEELKRSRVTSPRPHAGAGQRAVRSRARSAGPGGAARQDRQRPSRRPSSIPPPFWTKSCSERPCCSRRDPCAVRTLKEARPGRRCCFGDDADTVVGTRAAVEPGSRATCFSRGRLSRSKTPRQMTALRAPIRSSRPATPRTWECRSSDRKVRRPACCPSTRGGRVPGGRRRSRRCRRSRETRRPRSRGR